MTLPVSPNAISSSQIRTEFYNTTVGTSVYGTVDANLYNVNYYRGKQYFTAFTNGTLATFPAGQISFNSFHGTGSVCACDCACVCAGGDCP